MAAPAVAVQPGRATELGHADDQRLVQQPTPVQVLKQGRVGPIRRRHQDLLEPGGFLDVAVPAGIGRGLVGATIPVDLHQPDPRLDQAAGQEHALAEGRLP